MKTKRKSLLKLSLIFILSLMLFSSLILALTSNIASAEMSDACFIGHSGADITSEKLDECVRNVVNNETSVPVMTVLIHGVGGSAAHWSNDGTPEFTYDKESLIESIRSKNEEALFLYVRSAKVNEHNYKLTVKKITRNNYIGETVTSLSNNDIANHIVLVLESQKPNDVFINAYSEFKFMVNKFLYEFKYWNIENPKINLIGHSRGGNLCVKYANEFYNNVDSLYTIGTPHNGSKILDLGILLEDFGVKELPISIDDAMKELASTRVASLQLKNDWNKLYSQGLNSAITAQIFIFASLIQYIVF